MPTRKQRRSLSLPLAQELAQEKDSMNSDEPPVIYHNLEELNVSADSVLDGNYNMTYGKINITGNSLVLSGLPHFAEYHITIYACQDVTAIDHYCSGRPLWTSMKTDAIPEHDVIEPESVVLLNVTDGKPNDRKIYWSPPKDPNGFVIAYRAKLIRDDESSQLEHGWSTEQCVLSNDFEENGGIVFAGLSDGRYSLEVRVETSSLQFNNATLIKDLFVLYTPGFFTPTVIAIIVCATLLILGIVGISTYFFVHRLFGKKVEEYWRQTISANPEYLSQMDIYKADEWELKREDLVLEVEIGRGTFGKVLRGYGKNILSHTGEVFGECAVKTVPETANNAERLHFLIEASVMKQFNTAFIVKLYGVVSDGQPVLVVMELMEKGNLRDFLRSHRPNAEENRENRSVPTLLQYFTWAAQIADGMSYLESLKFCHRDLAARNCMVHADESVKIGDFGMARDIYYHEYYKPAGKRLMPVRWMAPESLKDGKFTMKSDIWSFGIVMYEMLTLGQQPYAGLGNDQVFNFIGVQRHVLRKPTECPPFWYKLMRTCWRYDPRERPSFHHIVKHLQDFTTEHFQKNSFVLNNLQNWSEHDQYYDFDFDLSDETADQSNIYNEEFAYNQDEDEEDGSLHGGHGDFASEEDLRTPMLHNANHNSNNNNNRSPNQEEEDGEAEQEQLTDLKVASSPRRQTKIDQALVENTF